MNNEDKIIDELSNLLSDAIFIRKSSFQDYYGDKRIPLSEYDGFLMKVLNFFKEVLNFKDNNINIIEIEKCLGKNKLCNLDKVENIVQTVKTYIGKGYIKISSNEIITKNEDIIETLEKIFKNFHKMVIKLRDRHENRATLEVEDEYDVQDLLYAVLQLYFDDIRKEEWTPSYAGNSSRIDFLLKNENVVIEIKKTRKTMKDKDLGEQLIVDSVKYKAHPDCKKLICFVYDPEGRVGNPIGIINDLENGNKEFLKVYIYPQY